jgi:hypothetical protein
MPDTQTQWHLTETYKGLITLSVEGLKMLALVNGGAAVAILAYLGSIASHPTTAPVPHIRSALICYSLGLLLTVLAFITAYLTQLRLYGEEVSRASGNKFGQYHVIGVATGCLLALLAASAFGIGCWLASQALGA